jgi:hypothetical protein
MMIARIATELPMEFARVDVDIREVLQLRCPKLRT